MGIFVTVLVLLAMVSNSALSNTVNDTKYLSTEGTMTSTLPSTLSTSSSLSPKTKTPSSLTKIATSASSTNIDWTTCDWKRGEGFGGNKWEVGRVSDPEQCIIACMRFHSHNGFPANQATVDSRSGSYCYCRVNSKGINNRTGSRTCTIKTDLIPCESSWRTGEGIGGSKKKLGQLSGPAECISKCSEFRNVEGLVADLATVDSRTGRNCTCTVNANGISNRKGTRTCILDNAILWNDSDCEWKTGKGVGGSVEHIGLVSNPMMCVSECNRRRDRKGAKANLATIDYKTGRYCLCQFNAMGISENYTEWKACPIVIASTTPAAIQKGKNEDQITMISLAIGFGAGVPLLAIIAIVIWRRRLKKRHMSDESSLTSLSGGTDTRERSSHNAYECTLTRGTYSNGGFIAREDMEPDCGCIAEISRERLTYVEKLGEGAFGKVVKCTFIDDETNKTITCAVKYLKSGASEYTLSTFLREAKILASFQHLNIISLLGACLDNKGPPYIVLEFMEYGDLTEYIRNRAGSYHASSGCAGELPPGIEYRPPLLSHHKLVYLARQIACGLTYLSDKKFVHRDIATRNCLVSEGLLIKIADFGLGHDLSNQGSDYYRIDGQKLLPVRWLPPEALTMGKFTIESDIWSYGVLLWELFTYGMTPYHGISNEEVLVKVKCYEVLQQPHGCPEDIYELMKECWNYDPAKRMPFKDIVEVLTNWMDTNEYNNNNINVQEGNADSI